jgi:hypothetical protein
LVHQGDLRQPATATPGAQDTLVTHTQGTDRHKTVSALCWYPVRPLP